MTETTTTLTRAGLSSTTRFGLGHLEGFMQLVYGRVSVIVITYNQRQFIRETLRSVMNQSYDNIQIIVSDDGSSDGTVAVVREMAELDKRIICIESKQNTGITENCNRGLSIANGEFVAWLGGDDQYLPEKIQKQVLVFRRDDKIVLVGTDVEVFSEDASPPYSYVARCNLMRKGGNVRDFIKLRTHQPTSSFMYRRTALPNLMFDSRLRVVSDWLFNVECALAGKIGYVPELLTRYRRWQGNVTSTGKDKSYLDDRLISTDILLVKYPELASAIAIARRNMLVDAAQRNAFARDYIGAASLSRAAIACRLLSIRAWMLIFVCVFHIDLNEIKKIDLIRRLAR